MHSNHVEMIPLEVARDRDFAEEENMRTCKGR